MSSPADSTEDELRRLASTYDMYDRLAITLGQPDIDARAVRAVILQLAGSSDLSTELGENIRGDIHLAIVSDASANLSRFFSAVVDLAQQETAHMNGTNTSLAGAIGSVSGGSLKPGPLLEEEIGLTVIEQLDSTGSKTQDAFQQVLDTGSYSFAKASYRDTVSAPGSVLIGINPKYGNFDPYEPIGRQLNLTPPLLSGVDLALVNIANRAAAIDSSEESLTPELARQYLSLARSQDPELTQETADEIDEFVIDIEVATEDEDIGPTPGRVRLKETLVRFSIAHARLRLANQTTRADAKRVIPLVKDTFEALGIITVDEELEAEVIETGTTKSQNDRIDNLKQFIAEIQEENDEGAPVDAVIERADEAGIDPSKAEHEIEKLKQKGEAYEPRSDHLRVWDT